MTPPPDPSPTAAQTGLPDPSPTVAQPGLPDPSPTVAQPGLPDPSPTVAQPGPPANRDHVPSIVSETFRNLVGQFSQELCFYRELIQNALDAGSRVIEVRAEYTCDRGLAVAHVIDFGSGMDRHIIDTLLTRLFSSSKEGDFTKIGKFGIGFVSVFAIAPQAVVVDTGRGGEYWRVIFSPDGSFERIQLDTPVEGTHVQIYKPMAADDFHDFLARSKRTVKYWCRHAEAEIRFNGERMDEPFDLGATVKVHKTLQGTEVVAGLAAEKEPFFGFYNSGITLLEGRRTWIEGATFKLKSRYLEHTLTRDNVKQDQNFEKAMHILQTVVANELPQALATSLKEALSTPVDSLVWHDLLDLARLHLDRVPRDLPFLPRLDGGTPLTLHDLAAVGERTSSMLSRLKVTQAGIFQPRRAVILVEVRRNHLTDALDRAKLPVLRATSDDRLRELLRAAGWEGISANTLLGLPLPAPPPPPLLALADAAQQLLGQCGIPLADVHFGRFAYEGSPISDRPFVIQEDLTLPCSAHCHAVLDEDQAPSLLTSFHKRHVVLNVDHPLLQRMASCRFPRLGAYLLAKLLCLSDGLHPETERRLLDHSMLAHSTETP